MNEDTTNRTHYGYGTARPDQNVRDTSAEAFTQIKGKRKYKTEVKITLEALKKLGRASRKMLSEYTGFPINKITQYAKVILEGDNATECDQKEPCGISGNSCRYLEYVTSM